MNQGGEAAAVSAAQAQELFSCCSSLSLHETPPKGQQKSAFLPCLQTSGPYFDALGAATLRTQGLFWAQSSPVPFLATDIVHDGAEEGGPGGQELIHAGSDID